MITNLLDKVVKFKGLKNVDDEHICKICAIYEKSGFIMAAIICVEDGSIHEGIPIEKLTIVDEHQYSVILFWNYNEKIRAIKCIRGIVSMDLKSAKEWVESHPNRCPVKDKLTYAEAEEIKRRIAFDNMECEVRRII